MLTISVNTAKRDKSREQERRARQRRADQLEELKRTRAVLERAVVVARTLGDDAAVWEDFLDADVSRVRRYLLSSLQLTKEASILTRANAQHKQLLEEHKLATQVLSSMLHECHADDWEWNVARWREIANQYYVPWTRAMCQEEMDAAVKEVNAFQWSTDKHTTGASFLGWRDVRRVDPVRTAFQFEFYKTFRGYDMMGYVNAGWDAYTDTKMYHEIIIGPRAQMLNGVTTGHRVRAFHEVLQQLGPNIIIMRNIERYPDIAVDAHLVYIVFRVRDGRSVTQFVRSVCCPDLMKAIDGPRDVWPSNFIWLQWDPLENDDRSYKMRIGGSIGGTDVNYANQWMFEALGCVLRSERVATGRQLITSE